MCTSSSLLHRSLREDEEKRGGKNSANQDLYPETFDKICSQYFRAFNKHEKITRFLRYVKMQESIAEFTTTGIRWVTRGSIKILDVYVYMYTELDQSQRPRYLPHASLLLPWSQWPFPMPIMYPQFSSISAVMSSSWTHGASGSMHAKPIVCPHIVSGALPTPGLSSQVHSQQSPPS